MCIRALDKRAEAEVGVEPKERAPVNDKAVLVDNPATVQGFMEQRPEPCFRGFSPSLFEK